MKSSFGIAVSFGGGGRNMAQDVDARERRTRQFEHYIDLMDFRARKLVKDGCFIIFSRRVPPPLRHAVSAQERFVQFAFNAENFYMDLPDSTLTHAEANRVVGERRGFRFFLDDTSRTPAEYERVFDPIQREYSYSERRMAAEDTAYLFFDVWGLRLDARIKVRAATFESDREGERNFTVG